MLNLIARTVCSEEFHSNIRGPVESIDNGEGVEENHYPGRALYGSWNPSRQYTCNQIRQKPWWCSWCSDTDDWTVYQKAAQTNSWNEVDAIFRTVFAPSVEQSRNTDATYFYNDSVTLISSKRKNQECVKWHILRRWCANRGTDSAAILIKVLDRVTTVLQTVLAGDTTDKVIAGLMDIAKISYAKVLQSGIKLLDMNEMYFVYGNLNNDCPDA